MWIAGGVLAGAGALEYAWNSSLTPPFRWLCLAGGIVLVLAVVATAGAAAKAGSRLPLVGVLLFFAGFLTLFFGIGVALALLGFALYLFGVSRTGVVEKHALAFAVALVLLSLPVAILSDNQLAGMEVALAAACATGVGAATAYNRPTSAARPLRGR
jgi:hypothetical protein